MLSGVRRLALVAPLALALTSAAPASAAQRYASPSGTALNSCAVASAPCDIVTAIDGKSGNMPVAGDEVIVEPGDYYKIGTASTPLASALIPPVDEKIHGVAGQARPVIHSTGNSYALSLTAITAGMTASDLDIEQTGAGNGGLYLYGASVDRLIVHATQGDACSPDSGTITNSVCWTSASSGYAGVDEDWGNNTPTTSTLGNVDVYATQPGTDAISISGSGVGKYTLNASNVIARGGGVIGGSGFDVDVDSATTSFAVNLDHSDYVTASASGTGNPTVTAAGSASNITADPALVNPAGGDFHETAGSPTIDNGVTSALNGSLDFDGQARTVDGFTDIGADEFFGAPLVTATPISVTSTAAILTGTVNAEHEPTMFAFRYGTSPSLGSSTATQPLPAGHLAQDVAAAIANLAPSTVYYWQLVANNGSGNAATTVQTFKTAATITSPAPAPAISALAVNPRSFRAAASGASIAKRKPRPMPGTVVSYRDSEVATTTFTVTQARPGVKSGKRCVALPRPQRGKPTRHPGRPCIRAVSLGSFTHVDVAGANHFRFSGRLHGHALARGAYRLVAVPKNAGGRTGTARSIAFKIIR